MKFKFMYTYANLREFIQILLKDFDEKRLPLFFSVRFNIIVVLIFGILKF